MAMRWNLSKPREGGASTSLASVVAALLVGANCVYLAAMAEPSPFYVFNLLLHPLVGLAAAVLYVRWLWRRREAGAARLAALLAAAAVVCGLALVAVPAGAPRDALLAAHVGLFVAAVALPLWAWRPRRGESPGGWYVAAACVVLVLGVGATATLAQRDATPPPAAFDNPPAAASMAEEAGPFPPSALTTAGGGRLAALPTAASCAGAGCHDAVVAEWEASPHRWAGSENPYYAASRREFEAARGIAAAAWCAGCHEPAVLATGAEPAAAPGVGCAVCHGVSRLASTIGQADFELAASGVARLAAGGGVGGWLHRATVRLDPEGHARAWRPSTLDGPLASETCAACHKLHYDEPVNGHRWMQTMNDYDAWQASHISGYGGRSFYRPEPKSCAGCHMLAAGEGPHRSHRFAGANLGVALLSGDAGQVAAVETMAAGAVRVDLLAVTLGEGTRTTTLAPLAGAAVPAGASLRLDLVVATPGTGHNFPGGKLDLADTWVELVGSDAAGRVLFASGGGAGEPLDRRAHLYGLRMIDGDLRPLEHGELWQARAEIYRNWILPLGADVARYRFAVPAELAGGELRLEARLLTRQPSRAFSDWVRGELGDGAVPDSVPALVVARATASLGVLPAGAAPRPGAPPTAADGRRFNDYGIGLFFQGDTRGARAAFERVTELAPGGADGWLNLAWTALAGGDLASMEEALLRAEAIAPELARTVFFRARFEQQRGDPEAAVEAFERAVAAYPRDRVARVFLLQVLMAAGEHQAALAQIAEILSVDPEYSLAHYNAMLAHRALGEEEKAEHHRLRYERFRVDDAARALSGPFLEANAEDNVERQAIHEHGVSPRGSPAAAASRGGTR